MGTSHGFTFEQSWASGVAFSPCSHSIHALALKAQNKHAVRSIQLLQYFAKPIDAVIQSVATVAFTCYDHFRDIAYDIKGRHSVRAVLKAIATPLYLPVKLFCALLASAGLLFRGFAQLLIPYQTIYSVAMGKKAAHKYFYVSETYHARFANSSLKSIRILKPCAMDQNPYQRRAEDALQAVEELKICNEEYNNLVKDEKKDAKTLSSLQHFLSEGLLVDDHESMQGLLNKTEESLNNTKKQLEDMRQKIKGLNEKKGIASLADICDIDHLHTINNGIPILIHLNM